MRIAGRVRLKDGRTFQAGEPVRGLAGVECEAVERVGNFVTVRCRRTVPAPVPAPIVAHVDDVASGL